MKPQRDRPRTVAKNMATAMAALFLLILHAAVQAQFVLTTNNGAITITGYNGPGGAVVIPSTINGYPVTGIGEYAFAYCTNLTSITITNSGSVNIGADAFEGCASLAGVDLTNGVTDIGEYAFEDCTSLTNVDIPSSVTNIGEAAFMGCASLTNISVDGFNPFYSGLNGVLCDKGQDTLIAYPEGRTNGTYTIPNIVKNIGQYAFASCSSLTNMIVNVSSIGEFAFTECTGLTSLIVSNNIGVAAFTYCTSLTNVFIAGPANNVGVLAFAFCTNLMSAYFEGNAPPDLGTVFYGDPEAIVYYPIGTTNWGATFGGAPAVGLEEAPAADFEYGISDSSVTIFGYSVTIFGNKGPSGTMSIPAFINGYPVTSILQSAFMNCSSLANVIIPDSVTNIGNFAFYACASLTNVVIPNSVTSIGQSEFQECYRLTRVVIPNSITNIGVNAFLDCTSLTSAYFEGNAPPDPGNAFVDSPTTVYYLPGTAGWGATFGGAPTALWLPIVSSFRPSFGVRNQQFGFLVSWAPNTSVIVQACTNLSNPVWFPVATNALSNGTNYFSDSQWTNYPSRYYRVSGP